MPDNSLTDRDAKLLFDLIASVWRTHDLKDGELPKTASRAMLDASFDLGDGRSVVFDKVSDKLAEITTRLGNNLRRVGEYMAANPGYYLPATLADILDIDTWLMDTILHRLEQDKIVRRTPGKAHCCIDPAAWLKYVRAKQEEADDGADR